MTCGISVLNNFDELYKKAKERFEKHLTTSRQRNAQVIRGFVTHCGFAGLFCSDNGIHEKTADVPKPQRIVLCPPFSERY